MTMLSKCKREVESKLLMVKKCLQEMDQTRRLLHGRLSSSSQNLQLDAQRYMVVAHIGCLGIINVNHYRFMMVQLSYVMIATADRDIMLAHVLNQSD